MDRAFIVDQIAQLTPEQALRAALAVYDDLPDEALASGEKWPLDDLTGPTIRSHDSRTSSRDRRRQD
jgi:hypothetical protein